jgi:uncharacterized membrane protein
MLQSEITPILIAHMSCGVIAILSAITALCVRKGSPIHRAAGSIFVVAMLIGASSAAWLGYHAEPQDFGDVVAGVLTVYLVSTAWVAAKRSDKETGLFEIAAFLIVAAGATASYIQTSMAVANGTALLGGVPGYIFAGVAGLAAAFDLSVILRGGLAGRQRIARHLWRMLLGFFIAAGSFFPGQLHLFPEAVREVEPVIILFIPAFTIIALMFFWLARVLFTGWMNAKSPSH